MRVARRIIRRASSGVERRHPPIFESEGVFVFQRRGRLSDHASDRVYLSASVENVIRTSSPTGPIIVFIPKSLRLMENVVSKPTRLVSFIFPSPVFSTVAVMDLVMPCTDR